MSIEEGVREYSRRFHEVGGLQNGGKANWMDDVAKYKRSLVRATMSLMGENSEQDSTSSPAVPQDSLDYYRGVPGDSLDNGGGSDDEDGSKNLAAGERKSVYADKVAAKSPGPAKVTARLSALPLPSLSPSGVFERGPPPSKIWLMYFRAGFEFLGYRLMYFRAGLGFRV